MYLYYIYYILIDSDFIIIKYLNEDNKYCITYLIFYL